MAAAWGGVEKGRVPKRRIVTVTNGFLRFPLASCEPMRGHKLELGNNVKLRSDFFEHAKLGFDIPIFNLPSLPSTCMMHVDGRCMFL